MHLKCNASKVWEFNDEDGVVDIYHHGTHTCVPRPSSMVSKETLENATSTFTTVKKTWPKSLCKFANHTGIRGREKP